MAPHVEQHRARDTARLQEGPAVRQVPELLRVNAVRDDRDLVQVVDVVRHRVQLRMGVRDDAVGLVEGPIGQLGVVDPPQPVAHVAPLHRLGRVEVRCEDERCGAQPPAQRQQIGVEVAEGVAVDDVGLGAQHLNLAGHDGVVYVAQHVGALPVDAHAVDEVVGAVEPLERVLAIEVRGVHVHLVAPAHELARDSVRVRLRPAGRGGVPDGPDQHPHHRAPLSPWVLAMRADDVRDRRSRSMRTRSVRTRSSSRRECPTAPAWGQTWSMTTSPEASSRTSG